MKPFWIFIIVGLGILGTQFTTGIIAKYQFENEYRSYWNLSVKASTIEQKIIYLDKFIEKMDEDELQGDHNAIIYRTPDNSFNENMVALKSLQTRLHEIKHMSPNSFEYQTAMQQITGQEQDEAHEMLDNLHGAWKKQHYWWNWSWLGNIVFFLGAAIGGIGFLMAFEKHL